MQSPVNSEQPIRVHLVQNILRLVVAMGYGCFFCKTGGSCDLLIKYLLKKILSFNCFEILGAIGANLTKIRNGLLVHDQIGGLQHF